MNTATEGGTQPHKELAESLQAIKSSRVFVLTSQTEPNCPVLESVGVCCMIVATGQAVTACCGVGYAMGLCKRRK